MTKTKQKSTQSINKTNLHNKTRKCSAKSNLLNFYKNNIFHNKQTCITKLDKQIKPDSTVIIVDYANCINILYTKWKSKEKVMTNFYTFLLKKLKENYVIYIVSKPVFIDGNDFTVDILLNGGKGQAGSLLGVDIEKKVSDGFLNIIHFDYGEKTQSNIDDLYSLWLALVIFIFFLKNGRTVQQLVKQIVLLTNDKQFLNKNLFGKTDDENELKLKMKQMVWNVEKNIFELKKHESSTLYKMFFKRIRVGKVDDTDLLYCGIPLFIHEIKPALQSGTMDFSFKTIQDYSLKINLQKKEKCGIGEKITEGFYLYVLIKVMQVCLYGDFYGSMTIKEMVDFM